MEFAFTHWCRREHWAAQATHGTEVLTEQKLKVVKRALKKMMKTSKRESLHGSWNATAEDVKASADVRAGIEQDADPAECKQQ